MKGVFFCYAGSILFCSGIYILSARRPLRHFAHVFPSIHVGYIPSPSPANTTNCGSGRDLGGPHTFQLMFSESLSSMQPASFSGKHSPYNNL